MFTQKNHAMFQALLDLGANTEVVTALLDLCGLEQDHLRYMAGPLVVHKSPWAETLPKWVRKAVYKDRLERIFIESNDEGVADLATPTEVMAYMYAATLEAPVSYEWHNVYLWCGNQVFTKHKRFSEEETFWKRIGVEPIILSDYERKEFLQQLQRDIRRTVVKIAAQNGWKKRSHRGRPMDGRPQERQKLQAGDKVIQVSLFDLE